MRLVDFKQYLKNITSRCYSGIMAVYGSSQLTTGHADDDVLEPYELDDGRLPVEVVHFLYYADTQIMTLEYNRNAASNVKLIAYVNTVASRIGLSRPVLYQHEIICHPDAIELIKNAKSIKSQKTVVPREAIESNNHLKQLLVDLNNALSAKSYLDTLGSIVIEFKPRRGKVLGAGTDVDAFLSQFPGVNSQSYAIEIEEGMEITTVNLMQPKFKNEITLPVHSPGDKAAYDKQIFESLEKIYNGSQEAINQADSN